MKLFSNIHKGEVDVNIKQVAIMSETAFLKRLLYKINITHDMREIPFNNKGVMAK